MNIHAGQLKSGPWLLEASEPKPPKSDSPWMDKHGWSQDRLNANALSHWDAATPQTKHEAAFWYPTVHDWSDEITSQNGWHPDKGYGTIAATSPLRRFDGNLQDAHNFMTYYPHSPENIKNPPSLAGGENLRRSQRVADAPDDPAAIRAALWGKAGEAGAKKITNYHDTIKDPQAGGAYNYAQQPVVVDSWMPRGIMWAHGEEPSWPDELNIPKPTTKKLNPETGQYESSGVTMPSARDIGIKALGVKGGYDRMANAIRHVAEQRGLPYAHVAQAGIWNKLGGTPNPDGDQVPDHPNGPLTHIDPNALYQSHWHQKLKDNPEGMYPARAAARGIHVDDDWDDMHGGMDAKDIAFAHGHIPHTETLPERPHPHPRPRRTLAPRKPRRPRKSSWYITAFPMTGPSFGNAFAGTFGNSYSSGTGGAWAAQHAPEFVHGWGGGGAGSGGGAGGGGMSGGPSATPSSSGSSSSSGASSQAAAPVTQGTGLSAATSLAQGANGLKYDYGGHGPGTGSMGSYDCSGLQSAVYNSLTGKNVRFTTDSNFKNLGFQPGYDPNSKFNIGTNGGSGENGHMAGELNGTNIESNGTRGVQYGGQAAGPNHPQFGSGQYHLPDSMIVNSQPDTGTAPGQVTSRRQGSWYITADEKDEDETSPQVSTTTSGNPGSGTPVASPGSSPSVAPSQAATPMGNGQLGVLPNLPQVNWGNMPDVKMGPVAAPNHPIPSGSAGGGGGHGPASPVSVVSPSVGGSGAPVAYSPSAGVEQWNDQVNQALQRNDLPLSLAPNVKKQIGSESSGNPNAINRVDSNAQAGHPSQGLLQTIPGTFNQYHHPGDSTSITDPQANLDAAIGYAKSRYGPTLMNSQGVGIGSGHGYDDGGFLPPGHTHAINNTGEPELVIPLKYLRHLIHSGHRKSGAYLLQASEHLEFHTPYDEHPIDNNWHPGGELVHPWHSGDEKHMASQPKSGPYLLEASRHYADDGDVHDDPLIGNTHTPKHRPDDMQDQEFTASRWYV